MTRYTEDLIRYVKLAGAELVQRAEELVGDSELITDFSIWLRFPNGTAIPEIEVQKSIISKKIFVDRGMGLREPGKGEGGEPG